MRKFELGQLLITQGALAKLSQADILNALERHLKGDWGEVCKEDKAANVFSLKEGYRIISAYKSAQNVKFWIITEADRSATTILLPEEY